MNKNLSVSGLRLSTVIILILIVAIMYLTFYSIYQSGLLNAIAISFIDEAEEIIKENSRLKATLENILPGDTKVIHEDKYRNNRYYTEDFNILALSKVTLGGRALNFVKVLNDPQYLRPLYTYSWRQTYYRSWTYLPYKAIEARHDLFVYYGGASNIYDFEGSLGFEERAYVDYHNNINFLVYKFDVKEIKMLDNQIVLIGEPLRKGVQVVAVEVNDILPVDIDKKKFLFQLSTPNGYEIDYLYGGYVRSDYKKRIDSIGTKDILDSQTFATYDAGLEELIKENELLKEELSKYIYLGDDVITEKECRLSEDKVFLGNAVYFKDIENNSSNVNFRIHYNNLNYKRPIYHPAWKKNYGKGWAYVPSKVCDNLHSLFIIPREADKRNDLFGNLGFFQQYEDISKDNIGFLIYNFDVSSIFIRDNQIMIKGTPSRSGAQIISIDSSNLEEYKSYSVYLVTPDYYELDFLSLL